MKTLYLFAFVLLTCGAATARADGVSGETLFEENCSECHRASNYSGGDRNKLADAIGRIADGQMKHKIKITLDKEQIVAVAKYMTGN